MRIIVNNINGVINIYKEKGYTSHDVVAKLRGILKTKKIGHTGTLDPDAEGVLPICIGNATKLCDFIMDKQKIYEAELVLGVATDTEDMSGKVIHRHEGVVNVDNQRIEDVVNSFIGEYMQVPPMYSAIKVNGKKLYDLAREGIEIQRKARKVYIYGIDIKEICLPIVKISVHCSKGTYIRTLCKDIGEKLGVYGCMGALLRTKTGIFTLQDSHKLGEIQELMDKGELFNSNIIMATDEILCDYPKLYINEKYVKLLNNGNPLVTDMFTNGEIIHDGQTFYRVYYEDTFMAVYRKNEQSSVLRVEKMFTQGIARKCDTFGAKQLQNGD